MTTAIITIILWVLYYFGYKHVNQALKDINYSDGLNTENHEYVEFAFSMQALFICASCLACVGVFLVNERWDWYLLVLVTPCIPSALMMLKCILIFKKLNLPIDISKPLN